MADKYVRNPYIPHHPHNVETKYVKIAKEGAKGTTHAYTGERTRTNTQETMRRQTRARHKKTETRSRRTMV